MLSLDRPLWTAQTLAEITGGLWIGNPPVDSDIRGIELFPGRVERGDLFVVTNPETWGDKFKNTIASLPVVERHAASAVMSDNLPGKLPKGLPILQVPNTRQALTKLAQYSRERLFGRVIGVTGSVGKTTTREMLHHVLMRQGRTSTTEANSNTSPGVALSVARTPADSQFVVYELAHGALSRKSKIARPHIALITEVALAHLDDFPTLDAIIDHKAEIFDGIEPGGTAILNRDSATFGRLKEHADRRLIPNLVTFGADPLANVRLTHWLPMDRSSVIQVAVDGQRESYQLPIAGRHMAMNSLAALATVVALDADWRQAAADLATFAPVHGRMEEATITLDGGDVRIINDAFNANPASMIAALATLAAIAPPSGGRRIAVLGEMKELGAESERLHAELAEPVINAKVTRVFTLGDSLTALRGALPASLLAPHAGSVAELAEILRKELAPGDVVLIKGSHGSHVGDVVPRLLDSNAKTPLH
ncbi:MAG TPA: UDP-N-acetylmuramoyl-tripeptide--D-alanyl-D-alanine ligase [Verrucomicrobiae bacterium]|nr:UDP-N-acetylmuramoyl-tripeptide--D-alanyl-D-alanine ligase [Verrucomicrobiae bacterium]